MEKLEANQIDNPGIRLISNCAIALGVTLESLIEPQWRRWHVFDNRIPGPPDPKEFLNKRKMNYSKKVEDELLGLG